MENEYPLTVTKDVKSWNVRGTVSAGYNGEGGVYIDQQEWLWIILIFSLNIGLLQKLSEFSTIGSTK